MTACLTLAATIAPRGLRAQTSSRDLTIERTSAASMSTAPGSNVTATFRVKNASASPARVIPKFVTPAGWMVVLGSEPFTIGADSSDLLLVSVSVPARISAGRYTLGVVFERGVAGGPVALSDSLVVEIEERRAVEVKLLTRPSYVIAGSPYHLALALLNRGNSSARFRLIGSASSGSAMRLEKEPVELHSGESKVLDVKVETRAGGDRAIEDILEIHAIHEADTTVHADLSATVTIVQPAGLRTPRTRLPTRIRLRSAPAVAGVSPYEVSGRGKISDDRPETLNFLFRGSPGIASSFGDRDEYRLELSAPRYTIRTGDQLYSLSQLMSGGQLGFGGGVDATHGTIGMGGYHARFRYQPGRTSESGAYAGIQFGRGDRASRLAFNLVTRPTGQFAGKLLGSTAQLHPLSSARVDMELVKSASTGGDGSALSARLAGVAPFRYDLGHTSGTAAFAGPAKGTTQEYASFSGNPLGRLQLGASANRSRHQSRVDSVFSSDEAFNTNLSAAWAGVSLEHVTTFRKEGPLNAIRQFNEQGFVLRTTVTGPTGSAWSAVERGIGRDSSGGGKGYGEYSAGATFTPRNFRISAYADYYNGMSVNRGPIALFNFGTDAAVKLPFGVTATVNAFKSTPRDSVAVGAFQFDTQITKTLSSGATLGLRVRHTQRVSATGPTPNVGYLEYSLPLGLPLGLSTAGGRAFGRVVDRATGRGIPNTLVRVGPQAALTDKDGKVYFNGLPTGEYRVAIAQDAAMASSVVVGDPAVRIDSADHRRVRNFRLAVDLPGTIRVAVRQMSLAKTGVGSAPDSVTESGPVEGVALALVNGQDTVYRVTDENGQIVVDELPAGTWTVSVSDDAPAMQRYLPKEQVVELLRGGVSRISFSLVPVRRQIKMIGDEATPLVVTPGKIK